METKFAIGDVLEYSIYGGRHSLVVKEIRIKGCESTDIIYLESTINCCNEEEVVSVNGTEI